MVIDRPSLLDLPIRLCFTPHDVLALLYVSQSVDFYETMLSY